MNPRKHKKLEETMILSPHSSVKSSITVDSNPSETRDSSYFPGCKKNANCSCEFCIASINATLDLIPHSSHRSPNPSFPDLSTPKSIHRTRIATLSPLGSTERIDFQVKLEKGKENWGLGFFAMRFFWGLILLFGVDYAISSVISGVLQAKLSADNVKDLGLKSRKIGDLNGRFVFLKNELEGIVGKEVLSCSNGERSLWKINQDGMLLNSKCVLYKSMTEEMSVWGWPLQTAGLLTANYSPRFFTVLSGKVTEWANGGSEYWARKDDNSSWAQGKWGGSVVQLGPNTWILEYRRSLLLENEKLVSAAMEFFKFRLRMEFRKMKKEFWVGPTFVEQRFGSTRGNILVPT